MIKIQDTGGFKEFIAYHDKNWTVVVQLRFPEKQGQVKLRKHGGNEYVCGITTSGMIVAMIDIPKYLQYYVREGFDLIRRNKLEYKNVWRPVK